MIRTILRVAWEWIWVACAARKRRPVGGLPALDAFWLVLRLEALARSKAAVIMLRSQIAHLVLGPALAQEEAVKRAAIEWAETPEARRTWN